MDQIKNDFYNIMGDSFELLELTSPETRELLENYQKILQGDL